MRIYETQKQTDPDPEHCSKVKYFVKNVLLCLMLLNAVVFRLCEDAAAAAVAPGGVRDVDKFCCFQTV